MGFFYTKKYIYVYMWLSIEYEKPNKRTQMHICNKLNKYNGKVNISEQTTQADYLTVFKLFVLYYFCLLLSLVKCLIFLFYK